MGILRSAKPCVIDVYWDNGDRNAPWVCRVELPGLSAEVSAPSFKGAWQAAVDLARPALVGRVLFQSTPPALEEGEPDETTLPEDAFHVGDLVALPGLPGTGAVVESPIEGDNRVCVDWGSPAPERCLYYPADLTLIAGGPRDAEVAPMVDQDWHDS